MGISHKAISSDEVKSAKLLFQKGNLSAAEVSTVLNRSPATVKRIADGFYDYLLDPQKEKCGSNQSGQADERIIIALNQIIQLIAEQNEKIDNLLKFTDTTQVNVKKRIGDTFVRWGDVTHRISCYGGRELAKHLDSVTATLDNTTLHLYCKTDAKKYLETSKSALNLIKQHTKNTIGYSVDVVLEDF